MWTQQTVDGPVLVGVAIDRRLWVALTGSGDILAASAPDPDALLTSGPAVSWTKLESEWGLAMARAVATDGRLRLAVGGQGFLAYTTDGVAWTDSSTNGLTLNGVATSGELWVAVGDSGAVVTSDDGIDWVIRSGPANRQPDFGLTQLNGVAAGGGLWIAVGVDGFIGSSPDGIAWTRQQESDATGIPDLLAVAIG